MGNSPVPTVTKQEVQQAIAKKDSVLLDVREPSECVGSMGLLPTAVNVPVGQLSGALDMTAATFKSTYTFDKPALNQKIIVYCRSGMRAGTAANVLLTKGFTNVLL